MDRKTGLILVIVMLSIGLGMINFASSDSNMIYSNVASVGSSSGGVTDHGELDGLLDDDHSQYGVIGHPHDQDLNSTDDPTFDQPVVTSINVSDYVFHHGDTDTYLYFLNNRIQIHSGGLLFMDCIQETGGQSSINFNNNSEDIDFIVESDNLDEAFHIRGSDGTIGIGRGSLGNIFEVYRASANVWAKLITDNTNGYAAFVMQNDARAYYCGVNNVDDWYVRDASGSKDPLTIEDGCADHQLFLDSSGNTYIRSSSGSAGYELDVLGDIECTSLHETSSPLVKDFIMELRSKPNKLRILGENLTYSLFKWNNTKTQYWNPEGNDGNGSYEYFDTNNEGYGIGINAYELSDWFNVTFGQKYLSCFVTLGDETTLASVNYNSVNAVLIEYTKMIINENIRHTKHMESWLGRLGYNPLDWDGGN